MMGIDLTCEYETLNLASTEGSLGALTSGSSDWPSLAGFGGSPVASSKVGNTSISEANPRVGMPAVGCHILHGIVVIRSETCVSMQNTKHSAEGKRKTKQAYARAGTAFANRSRTLPGPAAR